MLTVHPLPAFDDNYIWLVEQQGQAVVVDPGQAPQVSGFLADHGLTLAAALVTHRHSDHTGGVADLARQYAMPVYAPAAERIPGATRALSDGDTVAVPGFPVFQVLGVPGHTPGHIAFLSDNALFCGDTLFGGGCGRLLGGTAAQLHASLLRLAGLPDETLIYCAHEYTLDNLRFALNVEPANAALQTRLERDTQRRRAGLPTLPSSLGEEKRTNPFLRCHRPAVAAAASAHAGRQLDTPAEVFAALRRWKDHWHGQSA